MKFIVQFSNHPLAHHTRFLQSTGLAGSDPSAQEHEHAMRVAEHALSYDQIAGGELASLEVVIRRAQLIELRFRDKVIGGSLSVTVDDDSHLYLGTGRTRGLLMVCPLLEDWVAGELSRETAAAKERRKLREEKIAAKSAPNKK